MPMISAGVRARLCTASISLWFNVVVLQDDVMNCGCGTIPLKRSHRTWRRNSQTELIRCA